MNKNVLYVGIGLSVVSIGCNIILYVNQRRIDNIMDEVVESVADNIDIEVPSYMVEKAVGLIAKIKTESAIRESTQKITNTLSNDIRMTVKETVAISKDEIKSQVKEELQRQVKNINIDSLREEVKSEAREFAVQKFQTSLDSILEDHNSQLNNVKKIYSSIAESMSNK